MDSIHLFLDIATPVALFLMFVLGLVIKNNQAEMKMEQGKATAEIQEDFNRKHAENTLAIAVHTATDDQKFAAIQSTLARMDTKLDRLNRS